MSPSPPSRGINPCGCWQPRIGFPTDTPAVPGGRLPGRFRAQRRAVFLRWYVASPDGTRDSDGRDDSLFPSSAGSPPPGPPPPPPPPRVPATALDRVFMCGRPGLGSAGLGAAVMAAESAQLRGTVPRRAPAQHRVLFLIRIWPCRGDSESPSMTHSTP